MSDQVNVHRNRLLWAGFMAILATGVGFAIRGGIVLNWKNEYGYTDGLIGEILTGGLTGFCFGVIIGGVIADAIGYGWLILMAILLHITAAVLYFVPNPEMDHLAVFGYLKWATFIFALGNGALESVANPLVANLFPENRTHYLNILHASWPAGLALGGIAGALLGGHLSWQLQMSLVLIPTVLYGFMFFGQKFPKSEASNKGVPFSEMFKDVGILGGLVICTLIFFFFKGPMHLSQTASYIISGVLLLLIGIVSRFSIGAILLFVLFVTHALVGTVELGTDSWIQNITGNLLSPVLGKWFFVYASVIMFGARFCAHFIEKTLKVSPVGLLLICAITACIGLNLISHASTAMTFLVAVAVYAFGKTFFWPTMLAVASDRYPRSGAVAISIMGGIGMMAGGVVGSSGLGYAKDRFTSAELKTTAPAVYDTYKADKPTEFLIFDPVTGLDGTKIGAANDAKPKGEYEDAVKAATDAHKDTNDIKLRTDDQQKVVTASIAGDRQTLFADSALPATMAVIYLLILIYFKAIGGYKPITVEEEEDADPSFQEGSETKTIA